MSEPPTDVVALAVLRHPTRMRIVAASQNPVTVEEIAGQLGMPVTRLYHHLDRAATPLSADAKGRAASSTMNRLGTARS